MLLPLIMMLGVGTASAEAPKPLLWKVSDADNSLYLLGSFHMLKAEDYPLAKSTDVAFDDAEQVYFEITPDEANNPALGQKMTQAAMRTDGKTLQQSVSAETWKKFEDYAAKNNLVYHLWWHPHNFGVNQAENFNFLEKILEHYLYLNKYYNFKSYTMSQLANALIDEK